MESKRHIVAVAVLFLFGLTSWAPRAIAGDLVVNGGFESGDFGPAWVHGAIHRNSEQPDKADHAVVLDLPYTGNYSALIGFKHIKQIQVTLAYMCQDVSIPSNISHATFGFKYRMQGYDSQEHDPFMVEIRDTAGNPLERVVTSGFPESSESFKDAGWVFDDGLAPAGYDLTAYAGQTIRLYFEQANLDNWYETWAYIDDVSLVVNKFVDLVADGNGADVFGDPGTGLGAYSTVSGVAGDTLRYAFDVENEGVDSDSYELTATAPAGWVVLIDDGTGPQPLPITTSAIAAGEVRSYDVLVVAPTSTSGGGYDVIVDAMSTAFANRFDSATLHATVVDALYGVDMVVDGNGYGVTGDGGAGGFALGAAPWNTTLTYDVEVINTGNQVTAYDVSFSSPPGASVAVWYGGTRYTSSFTTAPIPDGSAATMTLEVLVASPEPGGDYDAIVRAVAVADTLRRDSIRAVLRLLAPRVDMIIASSGDDVYDLTFSGMGGACSGASERGAVVSFPVTLQNESSLADSFTLDWQQPQGGWTAVLEVDGIDMPFPYVTGTLAPFSEVNYILKVTVPGSGGQAGTYASILDAVSNVDNRISESVTATVSVSSPPETDLTIDGDGVDIYGPIGTGLGGSSLRTASPGDTVTFQVSIENVSGTNSFEVWWNAPSGWQVTLAGQPSPISAMAAGTYDLQVVIPASALGGTVDIVVDAQKSDKPYFMDSVTGRVEVVPPAMVDGLLDGNGGGVYGALGTGMGGSSGQSSMAPASLNFTVELRNLGAAPDQYLVTWNAIPLLTATLDGSASPVTTGAIGVGSSALMTFNVQVPAGAVTGDFAYIIDVVSVSDPTSFESLEARVTVSGPPRVDLVIDGDGAWLFGPLGSGQGGSSTRTANAGASYTASLRVRNVGSFPDSFRIAWNPPAGWPAGSVTVGSGPSVHTSPFWTASIAAGGFMDYTVNVTVPAGTGGTGATAIFDAWSSLPPNLPESVQLITRTTAVVRGVIFDDRDHDAVFSAGDLPLAGVRVTTVPPVPGGEVLSAGDGTFVLEIEGGTAVTVAEHNPSGYVSLSPDTLGPFVVDAGDIVTVSFADVPPVYLSPGSAAQGFGGSYVDFPHTIEVGTAGHVDLLATNDASAVTMFMLDENGNGTFDGNDRALEPGDTDLDPAAPGGAVVAVLLRVFVPHVLQPGSTFHVTVTATQTISGTVLTSVATAADAVVVVGSATGLLKLTKQADRSSAAPGEEITYSIQFFNAGADSVQNVVLLDPVSRFVDVVPNAFGPGLDVEWRPAGGPPVYLTFDDTDGDECDFSTAERLLRMVLSRNTPFYVAPGGSGSFTYRVRVR
jgi:uncharacterized repeat protein (TIGR01451 family)